MESFSEDLLSQFQPTSKDGKALLPTLVSLFKTFEDTMKKMFDSMKLDLLEKIENKDSKIRDLEEEVFILKNTVGKLEDRIEDNDAYERRDTIIVSGKSIPAHSDGENSSEVACRIFREKLSLNLRPDDISVAHRFGGKPNSQKADHRSLIVKFSRRSTKLDVISSSRTKKCTDLYVNEFLTPQRQTIAYVLRKAKKECPNIVSGSSSIDGKNFVWIKSPNPSVPGARDIRQCVTNHSRLVEFCENVLKKPLSSFISEWKH